jgi:hypothetical protein
LTFAPPLFDLGQCVLEIHRRDVHIPLGHGRCGVPQRALHRPRRRTVGSESSREGVPGPVRIGADSGRDRETLPDPIDAVRGQVSVLTVSRPRGKEQRRARRLRTHLVDVAGELSAQRRRQGQAAVLAALALAHPQHAAAIVVHQVVEAEVGNLAATETGPEQEAHQKSVTLVGAGSQQSGDVLIAEGRRCTLRLPGRSHSQHGIGVQPAVLQTEPGEGAPHPHVVGGRLGAKASIDAMALERL